MTFRMSLGRMSLGRMSLGRKNLGAAAVVIALLVGLGDAWAGETIRYLPAEGDDVVVYIHRFNAQDYEKGRSLVETGFGDAIAAHGKTRRTFFLENEESHEVMAVSFFHANSPVDEWHDAPERLQVLEQLAPLRREPIVIWRYKVSSHHAVE